MEEESKELKVDQRKDLFIFKKRVIAEVANVAESKSFPLRTGKFDFGHLEYP
jgi:hypothetical protein